MKQKELKSLIKECVREVFKEELVELIRESPKVVEASSKQVKKAMTPPPTLEGNSIFTSMLEQTKREMTGQEYKDIMSGNEVVNSMVDPSLLVGDQQPVMLEDAGSVAGADLSFLTNAKAIFDKANNK